AKERGGAGLGAIPSDAPRGPPRLPHGAWAPAGGAPTSPGLADRVCAAGGGPSRAVSHLRAAARVHRRDPAWGGTTTCTGWGARGMRSAHDRLLGESGQGVVCL